nr:MAG TPA: hypothetical protein [Caudoviricetes sp.]
MSVKRYANRGSLSREIWQSCAKPKNRKVQRLSCQGVRWRSYHWKRHLS